MIPRRQERGAGPPRIQVRQGIGQAPSWVAASVGRTGCSPWPPWVVRRKVVDTDRASTRACRTGRDRGHAHICLGSSSCSYCCRGYRSLGRSAYRRIACRICDDLAIHPCLSNLFHSLCGTYPHLDNRIWISNHHLSDGDHKSPQSLFDLYPTFCLTWVICQRLPAAFAESARAASAQPLSLSGLGPGGSSHDHSSPCQEVIWSTCRGSYPVVWCLSPRRTPLRLTRNPEGLCCTYLPSVLTELAYRRWSSGCRPGTGARSSF